MDKIDIFELMAKQHAAPVVARADIGKFTGGALSPKYLANQDCLGLGPKGRFMIGRRVVYNVADLIAWLKERSRPVKHDSRD